MTASARTSGVARQQAQEGGRQSGIVPARSQQAQRRAVSLFFRHFPETADVADQAREASAAQTSGMHVSNHFKPRWHHCTALIRFFAVQRLHGSQLEPVLPPRAPRQPEVDGHVRHHAPAGQPGARQE